MPGGAASLSVELNIIADLGFVGFPTVNDTGRASGDAETAARTRALLSALKSDKFHNLLLKKSTATSVTPV
jgi:hypothetical protein